MLVNLKPTNKQFGGESQGDNADHPAGHHQPQPITDCNRCGNAVKRKSQIGKGQGGHN